MFGEDRYNADRHLRISIPKMWAAFLSVMVGYTLLFFYFDNKKMFRPVVSCQLSCFKSLLHLAGIV